MFNNKEFEKTVLDKLDELNSNQVTLRDDQNKRLTQLESSFTSLSKKMNDILEAQNKLSDNKDTAFSQIEETASSFSKKLLAFENTKNRIEKTIHDTLAKQLELIVQKITHELKSFDKVHEDVNSVVAQISEVKPELERFRAATKNIKDVDFTLHRHAKDLASNDNKKLQLERENEKLKMMIAKMKQRH